MSDPFWYIKANRKNGRKVQFMGAKKLAVILRGIPGSGKSTKARQIAEKHDGTVICSADDYFVGEDGVYRFDVNKIGQAHGACKRKFADALKARESVVIVDNTNTRHREYKDYVREAKNYGYEVKVIKIPLIDAELAAERNTHGVPLETIKKMIARFED